MSVPPETSRMPFCVKWSASVLGVFNHLALIGPECVRTGFREGNRLGRNHMHQRAALNARKYLLVQPGAEIRAGQNETAPGPPEGFVGRRGHHVRKRNRRRMDAGGDQSGNMRHVHHQIGAHGLGDFGKFFKIDNSRIGAGPGDDHLGPVRFGQPGHRIVIDRFGIRPDAVVHEIKQSRPEKLAGLPWVRWPPWARSMPRMVSLGFRRAK